MAITIKEIQVSTKVTQQKKEPDLPLSRDLIQQIKEEIIREAKKDLSNLFSCKNWYKAQRKAKFYINKCRSASCMQGGLKQASA